MVPVEEANVASASSSPAKHNGTATKKTGKKGKFVSSDDTKEGQGAKPNGRDAAQERKSSCVCA